MTYFTDERNAFSLSQIFCISIQISLYFKGFHWYQVSNSINMCRIDQMSLITITLANGDPIHNLKYVPLTHTDPCTNLPADRTVFQLFCTCRAAAEMTTRPEGPRHFRRQTYFAGPFRLEMFDFLLQSILYYKNKNEKMNTIWFHSFSSQFLTKHFIMIYEDKKKNEYRQCKGQIKQKLTPSKWIEINRKVWLFAIWKPTRPYSVIFLTSNFEWSRN